MALSLPALLLVLCSLGVAQATVRVYNIRATGLDADATSETDCYVELFCDSRGMGSTTIQHNNNSPWWEEEFIYYAAVSGSILKLDVIDKDIMHDDVLGSCQYSLREGTHSHRCNLKKGVLYFSYELS